ncbi:MAG: hypothetical protein HQK70_09565, partial [Desulfamplus sp.]|nr:hypothetical protein [Desulfamplus sp.]
NVSLPEQKFFNVISGANPSEVPEPPQFKISVYKDTSNSQTSTSTDASIVTVSWSEVAAAYGYMLFYAPYPDAEYIGQFDMGKLREITFDGRGFAFYGAVKAYNSNGMSGWSNVESFNLR